jgi:hypothetical protein
MTSTPPSRAWPCATFWVAWHDVVGIEGDEGFALLHQLVSGPADPR